MTPKKYKDLEMAHKNKPPSVKNGRKASVAMPASKKKISCSLRIAFGISFCSYGIMYCIKKQNAAPLQLKPLPLVEQF